MDREQILREQTHKGDGLDTSQRIYYTLMPLDTQHGALSAQAQAADRERAQRICANRTPRLLCLLIEHLEQRGDLSPQEVDDLLFHLVT